MTQSTTQRAAALPARPRRAALAFGLHVLLAALALILAAGSAAAKCLPIAGIHYPGIVLASLPAEGTVRLSFLGHSSFLIETPEGASAVTDYNGIVRPPSLPNVVTMNNAHSTHYTDFVEPEIQVVLRGWAQEGGITHYDEKFKDLHVWNVPTNVRDFGGTRYNGNSIFVFKVNGLCIAHLGHLHHPLTEQHLGELGMVDVLLIPVDGSYTMSQEVAVEVIEQIDPSVIIPMHYFNEFTLTRFLELMKAQGRYGITIQDQPSMILSRRNLPHRKVVVLPGG